jgi:hypothetical protein
VRSVLDGVVAAVVVGLAQPDQEGDPLVPDVDPVAPGGLAELGTTLISWLMWVAMIAGFGGLLWCGIMMAIGRRNRSAMAADGATGIPWVIAGLSTVAFAAGIVAMVIGL